MCRRAVITGIGMVTPLGTSPGAVLDAIREGRGAAAAPSGFDASLFPCKVCAEVHNFDPAPFVPEAKSIRMMNRDALLAVAAAELAMRDAGVKTGREYASEDVGLFAATGMAGIALSEVARLAELSAGADGGLDLHRFGAVALKQVRPVLSFKILSNMPACFVSIFQSIRGINAVYNPWEGQGAQAIIAAAAAIERGETPAALAGGCDVKTHELGFIALEQWGVLRSWREEGSGSIPGEGAAFLVLEEECAARARGARPYARVAGYDCCSAIRRADRADVYERILRKLAGARAGAIVASGEGDRVMADAEREAMVRVGLTAVPRILPKGAIGNLFAAAAPVQVALAAEQASSGQRCLATCFGYGSQQAGFVLEAP